MVISLSVTVLLWSFWIDLQVIPSSLSSYRSSLSLSSGVSLLSPLTEILIPLMCFFQKFSFQTCHVTFYNSQPSAVIFKLVLHLLKHDWCLSISTCDVFTACCVSGLHFCLFCFSSLSLMCAHLIIISDVRNILFEKLVLGPIWQIIFQRESSLLKQAQDLIPMI